MRRKIWAEVFLNVLDVSSFKTISIPNEEKKYMKTGPLFILFKKKKEKKNTTNTPNSSDTKLKSSFPGTNQDKILN